MRRASPQWPHLLNVAQVAHNYTVDAFKWGLDAAHHIANGEDKLKTQYDEVSRSPSPRSSSH